MVEGADRKQGHRPNTHARNVNDAAATGSKVENQGGEKKDAKGRRGKDIGGGCRKEEKEAKRDGLRGSARTDSRKTQEGGEVLSGETAKGGGDIGVDERLQGRTLRKASRITCRAGRPAMCEVRQ